MTKRPKAKAFKPITPERVQRIVKVGEFEDDGNPVSPYDFEDDVTWGELRALLDAYGRECEWHQDADECDWVTSCGRRWEFIDGGPVENKMHRCMGCGGKVKETR